MKLICETYWKEGMQKHCKQCCIISVPIKFKNEVKILLEKVIADCPNKHHIKRGRPKFNFTENIK